MSNPTGSPSPATVLVVDDEDGIRELAREVLEMNGYRVLVAREGEEALRIAAEHSGPIDLLVSDMVMPRMSGSQLFERLALARRDLKALYISGYADQKTAAAHNLRAPILLKPFTPDGLLTAVLEALRPPSHA